MADVEASGLLYFSDGTAVPMYRSDLAEGTLEEVQTDATFTTTAQTLGDYKPGATVIGGWIGCANDFGYAYLERQGQPHSIVMGGKAGVVGVGCKPCKTMTLQAGDKLMVMAQTAAARNLNIGVRTNSGRERIFTVLGASGTVNPVDSITGNSLGSTIENETITQYYMTSTDGTKNTSACGVVVQNAQGAPVGAVAATNPVTESANWMSANVPVKLNYSFVCTFSS
tara:strand:- start:3009 stop:3686 length:678 start_codon:yes stop_codon:yes gene_type:complete